MNREISFYQYLTPEEQDLLDRSMQQVPCRKEPGGSTGMGTAAWG